MVFFFILKMLSSPDFHRFCVLLWTSVVLILVQFPFETLSQLESTSFKSWCRNLHFSWDIKNYDCHFLTASPHNSVWLCWCLAGPAMNWGTVSRAGAPFCAGLIQALCPVWGLLVEERYQKTNTSSAKGPCVRAGALSCEEKQQARALAPAEMALGHLLPPHLQRRDKGN